MLQYPIKFKFNVKSLSNDFTATDAEGNTLAYVRQKLFRLKEKVIVYNNESKEKEVFHIKADKWLDFNTVYSFTHVANQTELGKVARKGWASLWKSRYEIMDSDGNIDYHISEDNPWTKVIDGIFKEIPIINFFTGYFFNPTYSIKDVNNQVVGQLVKEKSFFGRRFTYNKKGEIPEQDQMRVLLALMMMNLLERRRG